MELFTDSAQYMSSSLVGVAVAVDATTAAYVPIAHVGRTNTTNTNEDEDDADDEPQLLTVAPPPSIGVTPR